MRTAKRNETPRHGFFGPIPEPVPAPRLRPSRTVPKTGDDILVIGTGEGADRLCDALESAPGNGTGNLRFLNVTPANGGPPTPTGEQIKEMIFEQGVAEVVVDPDIEGYDDIIATLIACKLQGVRVRESLDYLEDHKHKLWLGGMTAEWLLFSDGFDLSAAYRLTKRCLDVVCAVATLILGAPFLALIAAAIKLESRGPVLFKQDRVGRNGEIFTLYKFRSMCEDAEKETGPVWASADDDRVTRVGAILRKARLDELPQVINVLRNDISFVGPRPERPCFVAELSEHIPFYRFRELLKPGITGWAQICKGYTDSIDGAYEKLEYDLYYAKHASFLFDLEILARTIGVVFFRKGR